MRYNTGNPVGTDGSSDPRDLYDNAGIIDLLVTGPLSEYLNRLGVPLKSWAGIMQQVTDYLIAQGYESVYLVYGAGVVVERQTQLVQRDGELYRVMNAADIPLTLTGTWATDAPKLQAVGDAALRQALTAGLITLGWERQAVGPDKSMQAALNRQEVSIWEFAHLVTDKPSPDHNTWGWSPAIAAGISYVNANGGGVLQLGTGTKFISEPIDIKSYVHLKGVGEKSIIKGRFADAVNRMITSSATDIQYDIELSDFVLDRSEPKSQNGIILGGIHGLTIDRIVIQGFYTGQEGGALGISPFNSWATNRSRRVRVVNCTIRQPNNFGIAFGNVDGGVIQDNFFEDSWREAIGLECWGATSVVQNVTVSGNTLRMSTAATNHTGGSVGPAILIGGAGASYAGWTRNCIITNNNIYITDALATLDYRGIMVVGGLTTSVPAEDILIADNVIMGAPAAGIYLGGNGTITRRVVVKDNILTSPVAAGAGTASAVTLRSATDCVIDGNIIVGSNHSYAFSEEGGSLRNIFLNNAPGNPITGQFLRVSITSIFRGVTDQSIGGHTFQETISVANNATGTFSARSNPNRGLWFFVSDTGSYALLSIIGTAVPVVIAKSADVVVGAVDPGTASAFNIFPANATTLSVTNRVGSTRTVYAKSLSAI
ncbi:right-handed parallel beta-helix repeat-containing protein [Pseudomonas sp. S31]|uniref:right-handed parallel beta-helix repeat-containing protein n=1 Tax=Pseudomonas sp. S31 TaxID=1564473 RepID=UPI001912417C|nr:right-handed parallel beta-helix repeat-containing protein [Pseudomonas sp. S31]MBK5002953.1 right-handed parallel beta-helix repeat-containing protein [Pseudomonas sp. S31]